jgi:hypothetical protein
MSVDPAQPQSTMEHHPARGRVVLRRVLAGLLATLLLFTASGSLVISRAAGPRQMRVSRTHVFEFPAENPCGGIPRIISVTYEALFTIADPEPGDQTLAWMAVAETGSFVIRANAPGRPSYRGVFQLAQGGPGERHGRPEALVLRLTGHGSDGSAFAARLFEHVTPLGHGFDIALTTERLPLVTLTCS